MSTENKKILLPFHEKHTVKAKRYPHLCPVAEEEVSDGAVVFVRRFHGF